MIDTVIFDWSGVLCDDFEAVYRADMKVFEHFGMKRLALQEYRNVVELPWKNFYKKRGVTDFEKTAEIFLSEFPKGTPCKPMPNARQTLEWLQSRGITSAVLSAKTKNFLENECKQFGFDGLIQKIERRDDKRTLVNSLLENLGAKKENCLFVGDMVHDIETAKHAGIKSVAVLSGYNPKEKLQATNPDYIIENVGKLPNLIKKLNSDSK